MKILYIARHYQRNNDDEGAITHAFQELGHTVERVNEKTPRHATKHMDADFLLFHHWRDALIFLPTFKMPKVLWYFDLVSSPEPSVQIRSVRRQRWITAVLRVTDAAFCTDGDFVSTDKTGKAFHLMQGADERVVGKGSPYPVSLPPVLFSGTAKGNGEGRREWVDRVRDLYKEQFIHVTDLYSQALADAIASTQVVVCPSSPITDRYWSNRVYLSTGFGGLTIHPYSEGLRKHFAEDELPMYRSFNDMVELVTHYRDSYCARSKTANKALERVRKEHLYRHRVEEMLRTLTSKGVLR